MTLYIFELLHALRTSYLGNHTKAKIACFCQSVIIEQLLFFEASLKQYIYTIQMWAKSNP